MAEEPQPSDINEGADTPPAPKNAEDRAQAGALSSLDARGDDDATVKKDVDTNALNKAMQNLDVKGGAKKKDDEVKKVVKVDQKDVALLVCRAKSDMMKSMLSWGYRSSSLNFPKPRLLIS